MQVQEPKEKPVEHQEQKEFGYDSGYQSEILQNSSYQKIRNSLLYLMKQTTTILENMPPAQFPQTDLVLLTADKVNEVINHFDRLQSRISDTHSKVLVTGDLNAGKSTFVNTLLRRQVVPDDQEPCTALFVEVVDKSDNNGIEEVHAISDPAIYSRENPDSYIKIPVGDLREHVENDESSYPLMKVYVKDNRNKSSLLHNGIVDISLIDSPGLNIDSMKTTSLFSKQEEIDVIVFVVNAENHFTLSGKEFLETATKEKAYVFIVVNRFDSIKRKDRNKKDILEQIRSISQTTFDEAENLVHFVSCRQVFQYYTGGVEPTADNWIPDFERLESCLRTFILEKRTKSKLAPAKVYLGNVLSDLETISNYNIQFHDAESFNLKNELGSIGPIYERMKSLKEKYFVDSEKNIDALTKEISDFSEKTLRNFIEEWNGAVQVWQYAHELRLVVSRLAFIRLRSCHTFAQEKCLDYVRKITVAAKDCVPSEIEFDESPLHEGLELRSQGSLLDLSDHSLFDSADRFEIIKDFVPALGMVSAGVLGYRSLVTGILKSQSHSFSRIAKLAVTGLAITGVGLLIFKLSDMKATVQSKLTKKLKQYFKDSTFVETNSHYITSTSNRLVRTGVNEFQRRFQYSMDEQERKFNLQNAAKPIENPLPTIGFSKIIVSKLDTEYTVMDCSGKSSFRRIWGLVDSYDALVFVVDVTDKDRMSIVKDELEQFIQHKRKRRIPILILANKTDLADGLTPSECSTALSLDSIKDRAWTIIPCSASDGKGLLEAIKWLGTILNKF
ncbi:mitofusin [Boothiomyces sp. JEL0866]|nr:mitofusin [Boothiomyces sp. JEL0866]